MSISFKRLSISSTSAGPLLTLLNSYIIFSFYPISSIFSRSLLYARTNSMFVIISSFCFLSHLVVSVISRIIFVPTVYGITWSAVILSELQTALYPKILNYGNTKNLMNKLSECPCMLRSSLFLLSYSGTFNAFWAFYKCHNVFFYHILVIWYVLLLIITYLCLGRLNNRLLL